MRLLLRLEYEQKYCPILDVYLFPAPLVVVACIDNVSTHPNNEFIENRLQTTRRLR